MFLFGVTGGIGSGKTTVCKLLQKKGVPIIEADPLAKQLTNILPQIRHALTDAFGSDIYTQTGELNKEKLSALVFSDDDARLKVNAIIHPHVLSWIKTEAQRLEKEENKLLVGVEAALIYESNMHEILQAVAVVAAPLEKRIEWIKARNQLTRQEILNRMNSQMAIEDKISLADYVIDNNDTVEHLNEQVEKFYLWLTKHT